MVWHTIGTGNSFIENFGLILKASDGVYSTWLFGLKLIVSWGSLEELRTFGLDKIWFGLGILLEGSEP